MRLTLAATVIGSAEGGGGQIGLVVGHRVHHAARDGGRVQARRQFRGRPEIGRSARPVSVCGGRISITRIPRRRASIRATWSKAVSAALLAEDAAIRLMGCSATTALRLATKPPRSSRGSAARVSRAGAR